MHRTVDDAPVRRRARHGHAARAVGRGRSTPSARPAPAWSCRPRPASRSPRRMAAQWATEPGLVFACGRYEGIDQRVADWAAEAGPVSEVSLGDYVLAGGESAVLVMVEAVTRLLPGVVGNRESVEFDSHADGLLEGPSYTRPASWRGHEVPAGAAVRRPRRDRPLAPRGVAAAHRDRRPDLLAALPDRRADRRRAGPPSTPMADAPARPPGAPGAGARPGGRRAPVRRPAGGPRDAARRRPVLVHARGTGRAGGGAAARRRPASWPRRSASSSTPPPGGAGLAASRRRAAARRARWTTGRPTSSSGTSSTRSTSAGRRRSRRYEDQPHRWWTRRGDQPQRRGLRPHRVGDAPPISCSEARGRGPRASSPEDVAQ